MITSNFRALLGGEIKKVIETVGQIDTSFIKELKQTPDGSLVQRQVDFGTRGDLGKVLTPDEPYCCIKGSSPLAAQVMVKKNGGELYYLEINRRMQTGGGDGWNQLFILLGREPNEAAITYRETTQPRKSVEATTRSGEICNLSRKHGQLIITDQPPVVNPDSSLRVDGVVSYGAEDGNLTRCQINARQILPGSTSRLIDAGKVAVYNGDGSREMTDYDGYFPKDFKLPDEMVIRDGLARIKLEDIRIVNGSFEIQFPQRISPENVMDWALKGKQWPRGTDDGFGIMPEGTGRELIVR